MQTSCCGRISGCWLPGKESEGPIYFGRLRKSTVLRVTVGIDLGTSNSAVAVVQNGEPCIIPLKGGSSTMPSVVKYTQDGLAPLVGSDATVGSDGTRPVYEVKRLIGRDFGDVTEEEHSRFSSGSIEDIDGRAHLQISGIKHPLSPEEVSSHILRILFLEARNFMKQDIDRAVITVPAFFSTQQKAATITAAGMAGVQNVALIQEPIAAALAYGLGRLDEEDTILVVDMGGGTYDVSIVESFDGIFEVISTAGDSYLGGSNFTHMIANWAAEQCTGMGGDDPRKEASSNQSLIDSAEKAKITLGMKSSTNICIRTKTQSYELKMTSSDFDALVAPFKGRLWAPLAAVGQESKIEWFQRPDASTTLEPTCDESVGGDYAPAPRCISKVVLAGGSSQLPIVKKFVQQVTGITDIACPVDPKLCVALGAAVFGAMMEGTIDRIELMDGYYSSGWHDRVSGFQGLVNS